MSKRGVIVMAAASKVLEGFNNIYISVSVVPVKLILKYFNNYSDITSAEMDLINQRMRIF